MIKRDESTLLRPIYQAQLGADFIELGEAPVHVIRRGIDVVGIGRARLRFLPRFTLSIAADFSQSPIKAMSILSGEGSVQFTYGAFASCNALLTELNFNGSENSVAVHAELAPNPQTMTYSVSDRKLSSVLCHIVNFPRFLSQGPNAGDATFETSKGGRKRLGRAELSDASWFVELQELEETAEVTSKLKASGGYGITHVARLSRRDGQSFTADEAESVLQILYLFLSFARGAWTPAVLRVGYDENGEKIYENWGASIATPWEPLRGWFDHQHGEALSSLYPGFRSLLLTDQLGKAVYRALYWYLRGNRGGEGSGIDSGVILCQAAVERLSSAYLDANSVEMPKRSTAADFLRKTLELLNIPTEIPLCLNTLIEAQSYNAWSDGPAAFTRIRNELVHPKSKLPFKIGSVVADGWNLGQWYVELIILRLAGYEGEYSSRLASRWMGEVENVPWNVASEPVEN